MLRRTPPALSPAARTMLGLNPHAFLSREAERECFIEDVRVDDRWFRLEYQCDRQGAHALAFCRHDPFGPSGLSVHETHLMGNGSICTSARAHRGGDELAFTVERARFWCIGYSFLREHGIEETRRVLGRDW